MQINQNALNLNEQSQLLANNHFISNSTLDIRFPLENLEK